MMSNLVLASSNLNKDEQKYKHRKNKLRNIERRQTQQVVNGWKALDWGIPKM
jgi:hypothetical protein